MLDLKLWSRTNWFYIALPIWLLASAPLHLKFDWQSGARIGELITLFDWCIFIPALYALCYWGRLSARAMSVRILALFCLGLWIADLVVPDYDEELLRQWSWLRIAGLAALLLLEGAVLLAALRVVFSRSAASADLEKVGVPPLIAKFMLIEARFWRWIWTKLRLR